MLERIGEMIRNVKGEGLAKLFCVAVVAFVAGVVYGRLAGGTWHLKAGAGLVKYNDRTGQVIVWDANLGEWQAVR